MPRCGYRVEHLRSATGPPRATRELAGAGVASRLGCGLGADGWGPSEERPARSALTALSTLPVSVTKRTCLYRAAISQIDPSRTLRCSYGEGLCLSIPPLVTSLQGVRRGMANEAVDTRAGAAPDGSEKLLRGLSGNVTEAT